MQHRTDPAPAPEIAAVAPASTFRAVDAVLARTFAEMADLLVEAGARDPRGVDEAGLGIDASNANGFAFGAGVDFLVNDNFFVRADVRKLSFETDVTIETLGNVGSADVDPLVYGISGGFRF